MKKIFALFAALMMVFSMNAATKTIYCKMAQSWWKADGAAVGAYYWGTGSGPAWPGVRMTPVSGETDLWSIDIDTDKFQNIIFTRVNGSGTVSDWGAKTADLTVPTDDKNLYTITSTSPVWGSPGVAGNWSVYTPSETPGTEPGDKPEPEPEVYYITGNADLVGGNGWGANEIELVENEGVYTYTFVALAADKEYKMKVTNGTWDKHWGYTALQTVPEGVVKDGDGNIVFKMAEASDLAVAFDGTNITLTGTFAEIELPTVVYNVTVPEGTKACYIAGAMNGWSQEEMTKVDDTHYTISIKGATTEMAYKYCSGPSWDYEELTAEGGTVSDRAYSENDTVAKWKAVYNPNGTDPVEIKYVLMGVAGDWTNGIELTANPDNENEYVLLAQDIAETDAVKVVTLSDGVATAWCGNVDEYSVEHSTDDMGNIVLVAGKYDFYYKVTEDIIYIGATPATAVENATIEGKNTKFFHNGQIVILQDGIMFNMMGQEVK